jgi:CheY-like chemotaxis protein
VLVVEDTERDQAQLSETLGEAGYAVATASTGAEAIRLCRERAFDAVSLDLLLPDMSGIDVLAAIRDTPHNRDVPVIVVTVVTDRGAIAGRAVHDILGKPVDGSALLASLQRARVLPERRGAVLVVDDDAGSRRLMCAVLGQLGYRARAVTSAAEGLAEARRSVPLAVVLDLIMPELDGFGFLDRLRQLPGCRKVPVLVWTSKDLSAEEQSRLRTAAQAIVQKGRDLSTSVADEIGALLPSARPPRVKADHGG